eukprot:4339122-Pyramimonas_sp.AAC.1
MASGPRVQPVARLDTSQTHPPLRGQGSLCLDRRLKGQSLSGPSIKRVAFVWTVDCAGNFGTRRADGWMGATQYMAGVTCVA